jgi:hypothetical protein
MYVIRWAAAVVFCVLASGSAALAQQAVSQSNAGKLPRPAATYEQAWPKILPQGNAREPTPQAPTEWSRQDVELAQARCAVLLKGLNVVAVPDAPIRDGDECGAPAPMRLVSVGSNPQIAFSPPPALTCDMIAALHKWLERDVQPLARKHLGAPVVGVATMSSYSCRNAYGRARARLSEHGRVNALDVAGFVTARGQAAVVIADWGPIAREIAAQAAEAQRQREAAEAAAKQRASSPAAADPPASVATQSLRPSIAVDLPGLAVQLPGSDAPAAFGLTQPSRLGGPKQSDTAHPTAPVEPLTGKAQFLRAVHRAACKIFGTVLGPEANNAHKNHFHLDMAERRNGPICE